MRPRAAAFLRAINVGGHTVTMERLRRLFEEEGLAGVETVLASGNVLFDLPPGGLPGLEARLAARLRLALGYEVNTFVRTGDELTALARLQPFGPDGETRAGPVHGVYVAFLTTAPTGATRRDLEAASTATDIFRVVGREVHWLCRARFSDSPWSGPKLEKRLGQPATVRGLNTVRRIVARLG